MQDAWSTEGARESSRREGMLESLRSLNHRFLNLLAERGAHWHAAGMGLSAEVSGSVAPLSAAQKAAAADCPYALFDLRFNDDTYWLGRLRAASIGSVAELSAQDPDLLRFSGVALVFAWHVAAISPRAAGLVLGMKESTAAAFGHTTVDRLPSLAVTEAPHLTARWNDCPVYWHSLVHAAARPNANALRRVQLYGVQLAAAAHLH